MKIKFTTFSDHVAKVYAEINKNKIQKLGEALDRYGRHEKGCGMLRSVRTMSECTCGLHKWIREGGVKP